MIRPDLAAIANWIARDAKVLDLGCGDGALLKHLSETRNVMGYGVEIDHDNLVACLRNAVNVIQMDLESGLSGFETNAFDYVILSQTLQAMRHTEVILREMLRVGKQGIVTFPNFGHWQSRWQIARGQMPVSEALPYQWYDTPNIHMCTLADFEAFCTQLEIRVLERIVIHRSRPIRLLPNLLGSVAIYRFEAARRSQAAGFRSCLYGLS